MWHCLLSDPYATLLHLASYLNCIYRGDTLFLYDFHIIIDGNPDYLSFGNTWIPLHVGKQYRGADNSGYTDLFARIARSKPARPRLDFFSLSQPALDLHFGLFYFFFRER